MASLQRLLAGRGQADAGLEDAARRLAGAEAREADLAGDLAERRVDVAVELGLVDLDRQLDLVALEGLDRALHRAASVPGDHRGPADRCRSRAQPNASAVGALRSGRMAARMPTWKPHSLAKPHPDQLDLRRGDKVVGQGRPARCARGHGGQGDPGQRLQLAALPGPVRERRRARRPRRPPPRADRPHRPPPGQARPSRHHLTTAPGRASGSGAGSSHRRDAPRQTECGPASSRSARMVAPSRRSRARPSRRAGRPDACRRGIGDDARCAARRIAERERVGAGRSEAAAGDEELSQPRCSARRASRRSCPTGRSSRASCRS